MLFGQPSTKNKAAKLNNIAPLKGAFFIFEYRMAGSKPYSLGKSERLKSRKQIDILFESGKKITQFPFRLLYLTEPGTGELKAGFTVSSRNFPRAVDRNRIKRLSRESYRLQKNELENSVLKNGFKLSLFFIYTGKEIISFSEISNSINEVLIKLMRALHAVHA
jgi:ribonuclease P protein component